MSNIHKYICISCPIGCHLELEAEGETILSIKGNSCPRGEVYGREEYLSPKRVVTATCRTNSVEMPRVPVKTDGALLKEHIDPLLKELYSLKLNTPLERGNVVLQNFRNTGINVVITRTVR